MAGLSVVFLSFAILQLTWGLDVYHSKYGSLSPGIVPSPAVPNNIYRGFSDLLYSNFPSYGAIASINPSLFNQILLHELLQSGKVPEIDVLPETEFEEENQEVNENEEEIKIDVRESIEDMHEFDRFFSL